MVSSIEKRRIFSTTLTKYTYVILKIKGSIQGRDIRNAICPDDNAFFVKVDTTNQLLIPWSSIVEMINTLDGDKINILPLRIDDCYFVSQFNVRTIVEKSVGKIIGSS